MAEDEKKQGPGLTNNSFIVAALVASGAYYFYAMAPLQVSRPVVSEPQIHEKFDGQDIESRQWQDPFAAVARAIEKKQVSTESDCKDILSRKTKRNEASDHEAQHCRSPLMNEAGAMQHAVILGVTVSGAPYYEDGETRRRLRYAVLSGLYAKGYAPEDEQHLGYFRPDGNNETPLPETIPYEWFRPDGRTKGNEESRGETKPSRRVLVLWIDEDVLAKKDKPLKQISRLKEVLCKQGITEVQTGKVNKAAVKEKIVVCGQIDFRILGPYGSSVLEALTRERSSEDGANPSVRYYSVGATISQEEMERAGPRSKDVDVFRTIAQDDVLASTMVEELKRRTFRPIEAPKQFSVALISDHDTLYGRSIVKIFKRKFLAASWRPEAESSRSQAAEKIKDLCVLCAENIITLTYLRGMDGALPPTDSGGNKSSKKNSDKDATKEAEESKILERPFGEGQFDYLRRLAASLKAEDDELRRLDRGAIRAIGVLGNDVFDKLLALRALKPLFPEAVFFTTDYDAALANPNEIEWSRNLVIASSYGPTLATNLQGDVPPFRSVYQASAFLATRLAIDDASGKNSEQLCERIEEGRKSPRLFEIDRKGDFLALPTSKLSEDAAEKSVHPRILPLYPKLRHESTVYLALVLLFAAGAILWVYVRRRRSSFLGLRDAWNAVIFSLAVLALIILFWDAFGNWATEDGLGEPIAWSKGVSVWPAIALRAGAAMLALGLIFDAWGYLAKNLEDVQEKLKIRCGAEASDRGRDAEASKSFGAKLREIFYYGLHDEDANRLNYVKVDDVWNNYVAKQALLPRLSRIAMLAAIMALFFVLLCQIYGWPQAPWRGALWWTYYATMGALLVFTLFLVFLVFDSTLLCLRFVDVLRHSDTRWPNETRAAFVNHLKVKDRLIDDWIDLVFIAERTRCISKLIYYPFAILALMIVSRSAVFDAFPPSAPIVITQIIAFAIVFGCALMLGSRAEKARSRAKRNIAEGIIRARALDPSGPKAAQLESLLRLVSDLHEGSFVPLSQQAPIRALLLPLGGLGWTTLLEYRLLPGL